MAPASLPRPALLRRPVQRSRFLCRNGWKSNLPSLLHTCTDMCTHPTSRTLKHGHADMQATTCTRPDKLLPLTQTCRHMGATQRHRYTEIQRKTSTGKTLHCSAVPYLTVHYSTVRHNTVQHRTVVWLTTQDNTEQYTAHGTMHKLRRQYCTLHWIAAHAISCITLVFDSDVKAAAHAQAWGRNNEKRVSGDKGKGVQPQRRETKR